jgi:hypothetical protein
MVSSGCAGLNPSYAFRSPVMLNMLLLLVSAETGVIAALLWRFVLA